MRDLRPLIEELRDKIDLRSTRERILIFILGCLVLFLVFHWVVLGPLYNKVQEQSTYISQKLVVVDIYNKEIKENTEETAALENQMKDEIAKLRQTVDAGENNSELYWRFEDGQAMLRQLFNIQGNVRVVGVVNGTSVLMKDMKNVYKHPIKITLEGGFFDFVTFLNALEQVSAPIVFESFTYTVKTFPLSQIELDIGLVNQDKTFISY